MIRAVIFDYGGTLVRPKKPWEEVKSVALQSVYGVLKRFGLKLTYDQYLEHNDSTFQKFDALELKRNKDIHDLVKYRELVAELFPTRHKAWQRRVAAAANDAFWEVAQGNLVLRRGARSSLAALKRMKLNMTVVSNHHNPEALVKHLHDLRISAYFSHILVSARLGLRKPDPRIFEKCMSVMKVPPLEAVFVGDSLEYDIEGAKRVGLRTILLTDYTPDRKARKVSSIEPDFVVSDLMRVPKIVSSLG